jgi:hypothetical protein
VHFKDLEAFVAGSMLQRGLQPLFAGGFGERSVHIDRRSMADFSTPPACKYFLLCVIYKLDFVDVIASRKLAISKPLLHFCART